MALPTHPHTLVDLSSYSTNLLRCLIPVPVCHAYIAPHPISTGRAITPARPQQFCAPHCNQSEICVWGGGAIRWHLFLFQGPADSETFRQHCGRGPRVFVCPAPQLGLQPVVFSSCPGGRDTDLPLESLHNQARNGPRELSVVLPGVALSLSLRA